VIVHFVDGGINDHHQVLFFALLMVELMTITRSYASFCWW